MALIAGITPGVAFSNTRREIRSANSPTLGNVFSDAAFCTSAATSSNTDRTVATTAPGWIRSTTALSAGLSNNSLTDGIFRKGFGDMVGYSILGD